MLYQSLSRYPPSVRLLKIIPSDVKDGAFVGYLESFPLDAAPQYIALSYTWGEASDTVDIKINGSDIPLGRNLAAALQHLSATISRTGKLATSLIWADAICINQNDRTEINEQVQLMGCIYSTASRVISWLGPNSDGELSLAVQAMESIDSEHVSSGDWLLSLEWMRKYPWLHESNGDCRDIPNRTWASMRLFFSQPYWRRVWIIQEMALARSLWIMVGMNIIEYKAVEHTIDLIRHLSSPNKPGLGVLPYDLWYFLSTPGRIDTTMPLLIGEFRGHAKTIDEKSETEKLEAIISAWPYQATNPKDKVFALQGLLRNFIMPDYEKTVSEVYSGVMSQWIACTGDLDLLRYAGGLAVPSSSIPDLPSWTPNWHEISLRQHWQPFPARPYFSDNGLHEYGTSKPRVLNGRCLRAVGFNIDTISWVEKSYDLGSTDFGHIYHTFTRKTENLVYPTGIPKLQALLRTILCDDYPESEDQASLFDSVSTQRLFLATLCAFSLHHSSSDETPVRVIQSYIEKLGIAYADHIISFFKSVLPDAQIDPRWESEMEADLLLISSPMQLILQQISRCFNEGHCLFYTSRGYLGSAPSGIEKGDRICVVQGCSCPLIIRRNESTWAHLGTCFLLGFMNGEITSQLERGSVKIEEFGIY